MTAVPALVGDDVRAVFLGDGNRLHHAAARSPAVAGINVYMTGPQTLGTVISISRASYGRATVSADKAFDCSLELF